MYGFPTAKTMEAKNRGEVELGGCIIRPDAKFYLCGTCMSRFNLAFEPTRRRQRPGLGMLRALIRSVRDFWWSVFSMGPPPVAPGDGESLSYRR